MARTKAISLIQSGSTKVDLAELSGLVISNIQKDTPFPGLEVPGVHWQSCQRFRRV